MSKRLATTPKGYKSVTPQLIVRGADAAIAFYEDVFGATVLSRTYADDDVTVLHAEVKIGTSIIRLMDEMPAFGLLSPVGLGGTPVGIHVYIGKTDEVWDRALAAGAGIIMPLANCAWGERFGKFIDPFGHVWSIAQQIDLEAIQAAEAKAAEAAASERADAPEAEVAAEPTAKLVTPDAGAETNAA